MPKAKSKSQTRGQKDLFGFFTPKNPQATERREREIKEMQKEQKQKYEEKRVRLFQEKWREEYEWLETEQEQQKVQMFCKVCRDHPTLADTKSSLYIGTESFRKGILQAHHDSQNHVRCFAANHRAQNPQEEGPMDVQLQRANEAQRDIFTRLFVTAYTVLKLELPFTMYPHLVKMQERNGQDMGTSYHNDQAIRRFVPFIYDEVFEKLLSDLERAKVFSVMADSSTDTSVKDLEAVYVRYMQNGQPVNAFLAITELRQVTAEGHKEAIERVLTAAIPDWKEKIVGFGSDGASVMIGTRGGVATLLKEEIPYLISIHCVAHRLELAALDAVKDEPEMRRIIDMLNGIYKQYHFSPKAWRDLKNIAAALDKTILKPKNLSGTRWLPHIREALVTLLRDYTPLVVHFENIVAAKSNSVEMQGRARNTLRILKSFKSLSFMHLVLDILECLSELSLKFQKDELTLAESMCRLQATLLSLVELKVASGTRLEQFQEDLAEGMFRDVQIDGHGEEALEQFQRGKERIVNTVIDKVTKRFSSLEVNEILEAAATITNTSDWPLNNQESMAAFGGPELRTLANHFSPVLEANQCDVEVARRREWPAVKAFAQRHPREMLPKLWTTVAQREDLSQDFKNLLLIVETIQVLPFSTAAVERGFSCMKRIKSDWWASLDVEMLNKLMFLSIQGPDVDNYPVALAVQRWWQGGVRNRQPAVAN